MNKSNVIVDMFRFYALTLVIPLTSTFVAIILLILGIIGNRFFEVLYDIWIGYYFTGTLVMGIIAWRIQLAILFMCFIMALHFKYTYSSKI